MSYIPLPCSVISKLVPGTPLTVVEAEAVTGSVSAHEIVTTFLSLYGFCSVDMSLKRNLYQTQNNISAAMEVHCELGAGSLEYLFEFSNFKNKCCSKKKNLVVKE